MYPQHEKLRKNHEAHSAINEFLEFCESKNIGLTKHEDNGTYAGHYRHYKPADLIAEFFGIDQKAFEREKDQMLETLLRSAA